MYRQAIVIFGIVIPGVALLATLVLMWVMLGKFKTERDSKIENLEANRQSGLREKALESKIAPRRGQMAYWDENLKKDPTQSLNDSLDAILKRFDGNQLRLASARRPSGAGVLGNGVDAKTTIFELTFEGGYGPMQEMLAELEMRMPQLVMDKMDITPGKHTGAGYRRDLKFTVTYMAWLR